MFADEGGFSQELLTKIRKALSTTNKAEAALWKDDSINSFEELDAFITERCQGKTIVLIIDESDEATNNDIFV
ncbi:MAG: hypothetical protein LBR06_03780, partial [Bacteroidales bacterium]|nr:hypothetical protein [Bacteroidales bacterium]